MDYIREELLRQQALLVILLTGQRPEPMRKEPPENPARESSRDSAGMNTSRRTAFAERNSGTETADLWEMLRGGLSAGALDPETAGKRPAGRPEAEATPADAGRSAAARPGESRGTAFAGTAPESTGSIRLVAEVHPAQTRDGAAAAELSRAFQRDARRYDGGFRLY